MIKIGKVEMQYLFVEKLYGSHIYIGIIQN